MPPKRVTTNISAPIEIIDCDDSDDGVEDVLIPPITSSSSTPPTATATPKNRMDSPKVEGGGSQTDTSPHPPQTAASIMMEAAQRQARLSSGLKRERTTGDDVDGSSSGATMSEMVSNAFDVDKEKLLSALKAHSTAFGSSPRPVSASPSPASRQQGSSSASSGGGGGGLQQSLAASSAATLSTILPTGGGGNNQPPPSSSSSSNVVDASSGISELNRIFGRDDEEYAGVFTPTPRPLNPVEVMLSRSTKANEITDRLRGDVERKSRLEAKGLTIWTLFEKTTTSSTVTQTNISTPSSQHPQGRASIEDRGSRFEAFVTFGIKSMQDVADVLTEIRSDARIAAATHPSMYACRVPTSQFGGTEFGLGMVVGGNVSIRPSLAPGGNFVEMGDDDGEEHAASKMMTLLRRTTLTQQYANNGGGGGVLVVVCRWYGGKLLGPVRFQHINSISERCIRQVVSRQLK